MDPTDKDLESIKRFLSEKFKELPNLESRIASHDNKISFLIKKLSRIKGPEDIEIEAPQLGETLEGRLGELKRVLFDHGLEIAGFNENGIVRLRPVNEAGFDTLRKLNTLFHINALETYFKQYLE
jgi:hypothetical protein